MLFDTIQCHHNFECDPKQTWSSLHFAQLELFGHPQLMGSFGDMRQHFVKTVLPNLESTTSNKIVRASVWSIHT